MCGIAGWFGGNEIIPDSVIGNMIKCLAHRGPDANDTFIDKGISLGHARLAIIDLDHHSDQPMHDIEGRYVIVYNGEVYNFRELREQLKDRGSVFRTSCDTEVVLEAYKVWGVESLSKFNGMFALAIWDRIDRSLFIARDRLGKKPLYYCQTGSGMFIFASELKALRMHPLITDEYDSNAIRQYLTLNYVLTSTCIIRGVQKLPPAHYVIMQEQESVQPACYWDVANCFHNKLEYRDMNEANEALSELLDDAVRIRMVSDVPLGVFLSGGLDSSAITASMTQAVESANVHTFSIGFHERTYSELDWAQQAANSLGVTHRDAFIESDIAHEIEDIVYHMDEPFADTSMLPTYFLSRFAKEHVTVALSGDGGDELFAGYDTYVADRLHHMLMRVPNSVSRGIGCFASSVLPVTRNKVSLDYKIRQFVKGLHLSSNEAHYSWRTMYENALELPVLSPGFPDGSDPYSGFKNFFRDVKGCHYLDQAMYVDLKTWLVDDILVKTDRTSMAHSLEVRTPFLDYRIVEFAASLPIELKLHRFTKKYILKKSQENRLSKNIIYRKKKGFNAPVSHWMTTRLKSYFFDTMNSSRVSSILNRDYVEQLYREHESGRADHGFRLFGLLCLGMWLLQNG